MDIISDSLSRIKQASISQRRNIQIKSSRIIKDILYLLYIKGRISGYSYIPNSSEIDVFLSYEPAGPQINSLKRISKPGYRKYYSRKELHKLIKQGHLVIISTAGGIHAYEIADLDQLKTGGELICI